MRRATAVAAAAITVLGLAWTTWASVRYDPRLRFRTISTARFDIHFHQGEEPIARRLAALVEDAAREVDRAVGAAAGRVQVILVDQNDLSNGWATPFPYNTIEIGIAAPPASSGIGNTDDWLRLVFVHEYTHIAHLSRARGWIGGLRRGFGRLPVLFPIVYQPIWGIEGLATWQESAATGQGRVPAGDFRMLMLSAARAGRFEPLDRANGGNVDWPGGAIPYLYGAYFHAYLAKTYGPEAIRRLTDETAGSVPYFSSRAYKKVFGRSLGALWTAFRLAADAEAASEPGAAAGRRRLTHHGFGVSSPRYAPDGRIFYAATDPHRFPAVMELSADGQRTRQVARRYLGNRIAVSAESLVVDEIDLVRNVGLGSDLYLIDLRDGGRRRLTREARALDPDVWRDIVACAVQMTGHRALATFPLPQNSATAQPAILVDDPEADFSSPRWSPDGRWIAAERRRRGGPAEIVLVDVAARTIRTLASVAGGRSTAPSWLPDGSAVLFSSTLETQGFRIFTADVETGALAYLDGTGSAEFPAVSPDGRIVTYVGYTADGYDLYSLPLSTAVRIPVRAAAPTTPTVQTVTAAAPPAGASRRYSPARTLLPTFWTPTIESDGDEVVVGAATGSTDALGRHAYGVEAGWSGRARPDWQAAYAYDRWWPTIFAAASDDTDPWRTGDVRSVDVDAGVLLRVSRIRFSHTTLLALHAGQDRFACGDCVPALDARQRIRSVRLGWTFSNARAFGYSISAEEGGRFTTTLDIPRTGLGADGNGVAAAVEGRRYLRAGPRHAALAVRGAAAASWGDEEVRRELTAAGNGPVSSGFDFGRDAIGLLRGFDEADVTGTRAAVMNVDYRVPVMRLDRGVGTAPVFFRAVHAAAFLDVGHAWTGTARWGDRRTSIGAEVGMDTVVGFAVPLTFAAGVAWRHDGQQGARGIAVFGRIGRAF
jgi:hypothetical protein